MTESLLFALFIIAGLIVHCVGITKERDHLLARIKDAEMKALRAPSKAAEDFLAVAPKFIYETVSKTATKTHRIIRELSLVNSKVEKQYEVLTECDSQGRPVIWSRDYGPGRKQWTEYVYAADGKTEEELEFGFEGERHERILRKLDERGRTHTILRFSSRDEHTHTAEVSFDHLDRKVRETLIVQYVLDRRTQNSVHVSKAAEIPPGQVFAPKPDYWIYHYADDESKNPFLEEEFRGDGMLKSTTRYIHDESGRLRCTEGPNAKRWYRFYQADAIEPCMVIEIDAGSILPRFTMTVTQYEYLKEAEAPIFHTPGHPAANET